MAFVVCQPTAAVAIKVIKANHFVIVIIYTYYKLIFLIFSELYSRY